MNDDPTKCKMHRAQVPCVALHALSMTSPRFSSNILKVSTAQQNKPTKAVEGDDMRGCSKVVVVH